MKPSNWVIGILIFTGVILSIGSIIGGFNSNYNLNINDTASYDHLNEISVLTEDIKNQTETANIEQQSFLETVSHGAITGTKLTLSSFSWMATSLNSAGKLLGLPDWAGILFFTLLLVMLLFAIISIMNRDDT